jgi:transportin-3
MGTARDEVISQFTSPEGQPYVTPPEVREAVKTLIISQGQPLAQAVAWESEHHARQHTLRQRLALRDNQRLNGLANLRRWLQTTLQMLPSGTMKHGEAERLLKNVSDKVQSGDPTRQGSSRLGK